MVVAHGKGPGALARSAQTTFWYGATAALAPKPNRPAEYSDPAAGLEFRSDDGTITLVLLTREEGLRMIHDLSERLRVKDVQHTIADQEPVQTEVQEDASKIAS
jgi:hypothetical protein